MQILRQGRAWGDLLHPLIGVPEVFAEPQVCAGFKAAAAQHALHGAGATLVGVRQHRQGRRSFLQGAGQDLGAPSVQADPVGGLPAAADASEGQLQRCRGGMKSKPLRTDAVAKDAP